MIITANELYKLGSSQSNGARVKMDGGVEYTVHRVKFHSKPNDTDSIFIEGYLDHDGGYTFFSYDLDDKLEISFNIGFDLL